METYTQKSFTSAKSTDEGADTDQMCMTGVGLTIIKEIKIIIIKMKIIIKTKKINIL